MAKYEVQKGRTVLTLKGTAHEGAKLELKNFSGDDGQEKIDSLIKLGALKEVPLTEAESEALAKAEEKRAEAREKVEKLRLEAVAKANAIVEKANEAKALKEAAIMDADFDSMNKAPMIEFSEKWKIDLTGKTAEDIREELKALQETLTAPDE